MAYWLKGTKAKPLCLTLHASRLTPHTLCLVPISYFMTIFLVSDFLSKVVFIK